MSHGRGRLTLPAPWAGLVALAVVSVLVAVPVSVSGAPRGAPGPSGKASSTAKPTTSATPATPHTVAPPRHNPGGHGTQNSGLRPLAATSTISTPVVVDSNNMSGSVCLADNSGQFNANEPAVAQSTDDRNHFVVIAQSCHFPPTVWVSDGGTNWSPHTLAIQNTFAGDTVIAYDPAHHLFVAAFLDFTENPNGGEVPEKGRLAVKVSSDGGTTWTNDRTLYIDYTPSVFGTLQQSLPYFSVADRPNITVDSTPSSPHYGRVAVSFSIFHFDQSENELGTEVVSTYTDDPAGSNPKNWSPSIRISTRPGYNQGVAVAFSPSGDLLAVWVSGELPVPPGVREKQILSRNSADGGAHFGAVHQVGLINDMSEDCPISATPNHLDTRCDSFPSIASYPAVKSSDGKTRDSAFVVVWADFGSGNPEIKGRITETDGSDWGAGPVNDPDYTGKLFIVDDQGGNGTGMQTGAKFEPHVAIAPNGRIDIGYMSSQAQSSGSSSTYGTGYQYYMAEADDLPALEQAKLNIPQAIDAAVSSPDQDIFNGDYTWVTSNTSTDTAAAYTSVDSSNTSTHITFIRICYPSC